MATTPPPPPPPPAPAQRAWRAACPNCGAPVEFASAASASAVCRYCNSTLVREGEALRRIGRVGELFDDHSPLQLGVTGQLQGRTFTLIGRLQYRYWIADDGETGARGPDGTWNEWHAFFDNGRSGWLSEDNGAYVLAVDAPLPPDAPDIGTLVAGQRVLADRRAWDVASVVQASLIAAQGELPSPPRLDGRFLVADLRSSSGEVATLDGSDPAAPHWSIGRSVALADLRLQGLRDTKEAAEKTLQGRAFACPSCGAPLEAKLDATKSLVCGQCKAVVDLSAGPGAELAYAAQGGSGPQPDIPLGRTGTIALGPEGTPAAPWQVVGFMERRDIPDDAEEDSTAWREYLLYNRTLGFAFLVDAEDGWSWVRPVTGAPEVRHNIATWQDATYRERYTYRARVTWVLGEFYWRVRRDETALITDYHGVARHTDRRLSREQTEGEVTWSAGATLEAAALGRAFGFSPAAPALSARDVKPVSAGKLSNTTVIVAVVLIFLLLSILENCDGDDCNDVRATFGESSAEYRQCVANRGSGSGRTGGGSYGGWSSGGGGHK